MSKPDFVHLHNHTDYSFLDSTIRIDDLIAKTQEFGMLAVAITDSNNMCGTIEFYLKCKRAGIKPIIGAEISVTSVLQRQEEGRASPVYKVVLLCMNLTGYRNLCQIVSAVCGKGLREVTPVTPGLLATHAEGLICLSGGIDGELTALCRECSDDALSVAAWYDEHFPERYYIEMHFESAPTLPRLVHTGTTLNIPLAVAADCRCLTSDDVKAHRILQCIMTGRVLEKAGSSYRSFQFYPTEDMWQSFGRCPEALSNTLKIADRCNLELPLDGKTHHLPIFEIPVGSHHDDMLRDQALEGLKNRMVTITSRCHGDTDEQKLSYSFRLDAELQCIIGMGYSAYFLIVADYVNWAKNNGIPVGPGRGSVGGSLVAYVLGISDIDPIEHGLLFERFLDSRRIVFPHIYLDFCSERRKEVIGYIVNKYGRDNVCTLATFGTFTDRTAIRDVGQAIGMDRSKINKVVKLLPQCRFNETLKEKLLRRPLLKLNKMAESDKTIAELLDIVFRLTGLVRYSTTHAASIVIAPADVRKFVPVAGRSDSVISMSHFPYCYFEKVGLVTFYHLGLKNLTINDIAIKLIRAGKNSELDPHLLSLDDTATYDLISSGNTDGIFQLESTGMKELLIKLQPSCFEDIVAACALYRPGPLRVGMLDNLIERKHERQLITYIIPELEPILANTYGVIVYQEQAMQIIHAVAGYSFGKADELRRTLGIRDAADIKKAKKDFIAGSVIQDIAEDKASDIFDLLCRSAEYGFNKAHAVAYSLISYQSAWLKAHYPEEFGRAVEINNKC